MRLGLHIMHGGVLMDIASHRFPITRCSYRGGVCLSHLSFNVKLSYKVRKWFVQNHVS